MPAELIAIRDARLADHDALAALWGLVDEVHNRLHPEYFRRPVAQRPRAGLERILRGGEEVLRVAEDAFGEVVGLCHVQIYDTPPLPWMTPARRAHIDSLAVAARLRRRGIGRRLLDDGASWARSRGAGELVLTVWSGNEEASRFYASLGFATVNTVLGRPL